MRLQGTRGRRLPLLALLFLVGLLVAAALAYLLVLRRDPVAPLGLGGSPAASASVASAVAPSPGGSSPGNSSSEEASSPSSSSSAAASPGSGGSVAAPSAGLAGRWTVADGSVVGYRVREKLAFLEAENDAVGRTDAVTGEMSLDQGSDGARVTAASFEADLTQLRSDEERRDRALRQNGIETERFPTATFSVSEPINVPPAALAGDAVELTLPGDLTLHGVTKRVEIPAQARLVGGRIEVAGSLSFPFSDFQIQPPRLGPVVSISDSGTMEFSLIFVRG